MKIAVIGGGIAGSFTSYFLLKKGYEVVRVDRGSQGIVRTSANNSGILSSAAHHTPISSAGGVRVSERERRKNLGWFALARGLDGKKYDSLVARLVPRSVELYSEFLGGHEAEVNLIREGLAMYPTPDLAEGHRRQYGGTVVDQEELRDMGYAWEGEGVLAPDLSAHTGKLLAILESEVRSMGIKVVTGEAELRVSRGQGGTEIEGVKVGGEPSVSADSYVIAGGSWSGSLCEPLGFDPHILPARGLAEFCHTGGKRLVDYPASFPELMLTQHDDNLVRLTGIFDLMGFNARFGSADRAWLFKTSRAYLARPNALRLVEVGAGFRPTTPDQLPVVGAIPCCINGFIASGGTRKGVTLAPLMGHLTAGVVSGTLRGKTARTDRDLAEILSPSRFTH
ncbi:MAG: FAD-binding oxidoreductase [Thaumarchaeota archaeon]|nr:FAD-binding oxidoreductase [Nitrososphaerota archaeon]